MVESLKTKDSTPLVTSEGQTGNTIYGWNGRVYRYQGTLYIPKSR